MAFLLAIWLIVKRTWYFVIDNWRVVLPTVGLIVLGVVFWKACKPKPAKLDEAQIIAAQQAIEAHDDAKLKQILVNAEVKEKQIDANLADSTKATIDAMNAAHEKYDKMTSDQLAAEIEARK